MKWGYSTPLLPEGGVPKGRGGRFSRKVINQRVMYSPTTSPIGYSSFRKEESHRYPYFVPPRCRDLYFETPRRCIRFCFWDTEAVAFLGRQRIYIYIYLLCLFKLLPVSNGTSVELPDIPFCFSTRENTVMISYIYDLQIYIVVLERFLLKVRVQIGSWVHLNPVFCVKSLRKMILCKEKSFSFLGEAVWQ